MTMLKAILFLGLTLQLTLSTSFIEQLTLTDASQCPAGYYCTTNLLTRSVTPKGCPPGTFSTGGTTGCRPCAAGYWTIRYASSYCDVCPVGHLCANASLAPTPCPLGMANPSLGQTYCFPCPIGSYTPTLQSPTCTVCPHGHFCNNGAQKPQQCPPGNDRSTENRSLLSC